jgi:hypothetical protein
MPLTSYSTLHALISAIRSSLPSPTCPTPTRLLLPSAALHSQAHIPTAGPPFIYLAHTPNAASVAPEPPSLAAVGNLPLHQGHADGSSARTHIRTAGRFVLIFALLEGAVRGPLACCKLHISICKNANENARSQPQLAGWRWQLPNSESWQRQKEMWKEVKRATKAPPLPSPPLPLPLPPPLPLPLLPELLRLRVLLLPVIVVVELSLCQCH